MIALEREPVKLQHKISRLKFSATGKRSKFCHLHINAQCRFSTTCPVSYVLDLEYIPNQEDNYVGKN